MIGRVCVFLIRQVYQNTARYLIPKRCRYVPSCSEYAAQAIERHGALTGIAMGIWRVLRCNPWCAGGEDPVPEAGSGASLRKMLSSKESTSDGM